MVWSERRRRDAQRGNRQTAVLGFVVAWLERRWAKVATPLEQNREAARCLTTIYGWGRCGAHATGGGVAPACCGSGTRPRGDGGKAKLGCGGSKSWCWAAQAKSRERKERIKHHFKTNLDSNLNPFANFDQPKHHKNKYASA